ncbi:MAG: cysteine desulfurase family protein [Lachnospiraceae bacterium]
MQVYLDNSATTRCFDSVRELMGTVMDRAYGNPSSMHRAGVEAENYIRHAKEVIAGNLKVREKELLFTSGGTESDNLAIIGCASANRRAGMHLITTKMEHPAVLEPMRYLERQGFRVTYLEADKSGRVRLSDLEQALCKDTILVSVMHVNNEIGSLQPVGEIGSLIRSYRKDILFHVDSVQGYGKLILHPKRMKIDLLSISGHKIHGPKGVGILYVNETVKIQPILFGGGQQRGLRSGTENVPGIAGIGRAVEELYTDFEDKMERLYELKTYFIAQLSELEGVSINGLPPEGEAAVKETAPHVVSASVAGIRAEVLLHSLEDRGIYISSGSACASNKPALSETLKAVGLNEELLRSTVRFSFSVETTKEELDYTMEALKELLPVLRRYTRH